MPWQLGRRRLCGTNSSRRCLLGLCAFRCRRRTYARRQATYATAESVVQQGAGVRWRAKTQWGACRIAARQIRLQGAYALAVFGWPCDYSHTPHAYWYSCGVVLSGSHGDFPYRALANHHPRLPSRPPFHCSGHRHCFPRCGWGATGKPDR